MKIMDLPERDLAAAATKYRKAYDRGYLLEQQGGDGQAILDKANRDYDLAKARYAKARGHEQS